MVVKISEDFTKCVLGSMDENYMLSIAKKGGYDQSRITNLKNKIMRYILHGGTSEFIFICCTEYDKDLDVQTSMDEDYILSVNRRIEPNCINVLDAYQDNPDKRGYGDNLSIISLRDDEFIIDKVNPQALYVKEEIKK